MEFKLLVGVILIISFGPSSCAGKVGAYGQCILVHTRKTEVSVDDDYTVLSLTLDSCVVLCLSMKEVVRV